MGGWPRDKDAKRIIRGLVDAGWTYDTNVGKSAHIVGRLHCGKGCKVWVTGTGKNSVSGIRRDAKRCPHSMFPDSL